MHPIYNKLHGIVVDARLNDVAPMTVKMMLKEYLQNHVLQAIYNNKDTQKLVFYGGTALRKIYNLDRMSEDLDFESQEKIDLEKVAQVILSYFKRQKFEDVEYKIQQGEIIGRITFKFQILHQLGISPNDSEKLHVKVEINPNIQDAFETQLSPLTADQMSVMIRHYSLTIMMAGKMVTCLDRVFKKGKSNIRIKGRDYYDLIWYMRQKIVPDEKYLRKFGYGADGEKDTLKEIWQRFDKKVEKISSDDLLFDLQPFFVSKSFIKNWCDSFHVLYKRYRKML